MNNSKHTFVFSVKHNRKKKKSIYYNQVQRADLQFRKLPLLSDLAKNWLKTNKYDHFLQKRSGKWELVMEAAFVMVSRNQYYKTIFNKLWLDFAAWFEVL